MNEVLNWNFAEKTISHSYKILFSDSEMKMGYKGWIWKKYT